MTQRVFQNDDRETMATRLQQNLRLPLMYVLSRWSTFEFSRGEVSAQVIYPLAKLYNVSESERRECRYAKSGSPKFDNQVFRTIQILDKEMMLRRIRNRSYRLEEAGLTSLRGSLHREIKAMKPTAFAQLIACKNRLGKNLDLNLLGRLSAGDVAQAVASSKSHRELFLAGLQRLPLTDLGDFLWSASGTFETVLEQHVGDFRGPTDEERAAILRWSRGA